MSSTVKALFLGLGLVLVATVAVLWITQETPEEQAARVVTGAPAGSTPGGTLPKAPETTPDSLDPDAPFSLVDGRSATGLALDDATAAAAAAEAARAVDLSGRVVDTYGRPVPDATVTFLAGDGDTMRLRFRRMLRDEDLVLPSTKTDRAGRFALRGVLPPTVDPDEPRFLRLDSSLAVQHESFATLVAPQPDLQPGTADVGDLVVDAGAWVAGRVVDEHGRPLAGADVSARTHVDRRALRSGLMPFFGGFTTEALDAVKSGADGRFLVRGLSPGDVSVTARMEGMRAAESEARTVAAGATADVGDVALSRGATIAGYVIDGDGEPVEGATLRVSSMSRIMVNRMSEMPARGLGSDMGVRAETDETGWFELAGLTGGTYTVHASAPGFDRVSEEDVAVGTSDLVLRLQPLGGLLVTVRAASDGAPVSGAEILADEIREPGVPRFGRMRGGDARPVLEGSEALQAADRTGEPAGVYLVQDASPQGTRLTIRAPGFAQAEVDAGPVAAGEVGTLTVDLLPETVVAGHVTDPAGNPVADARVRLSEPRDDSGVTVGPGGEVSVRREFSRVMGPGAMSDVHTARTDDSGYYEVAGLPAGNWDLVANADTYVRSEPLRITLGAGERRDGTDIELAPGGSVAGTVTEADGTPVPGMDVLVDDTARPAHDPFAGLGLPAGAPRPMLLDDAARNRATTDADGGYVRDGLAPGRYRVRLAPARVVDFGGRGRGPGFMSFVMEGQGDEDDAGAVLVDVVAGQVARADFVRPRRGEVRGQVTAAGEPAEGAEVTLRQADSFMPFGGHTVQTDRFGRYVFEEVEAGDYVVSALPAGAALEQTAEVHLDAGATRSADLVFGGSTIRGRVVDAESGAGVADVSVIVSEVQDEDPASGFGFGGDGIQLVTAFEIDDGRGGSGGMEMTLGGGPVSRVRTDAQGRFELRFLDPGSYRVQTRGGGTIAAEVGPVDVGDDDVVDDVTVEAVRGAVLEGVVVSGRTGDPLPSVPVRLEGASVAEMTTTDERGAYSFEGLERGDYEVSVLGSGFFSGPIATAPVTLETGERRKLPLITDA